MASMYSESVSLSRRVGQDTTNVPTTKNEISEDTDKYCLMQCSYFICSEFLKFKHFTSKLESQPLIILNDQDKSVSTNFHMPAFYTSPNTAFWQN